MGNSHRCIHPNGNLDINLRHLKERALFVLQETLPEFFQIGLVTNVDKFTGAPIRTSILPLSLVPGPNQKFPSYEEPINAGVEPVYSLQVKLEYTPSALPTPFPRVLHAEGIYRTLNTAVILLMSVGFPLYLASASFLRHTMNALYSDLVVTLMKISFNSLPSSTNKAVPSSGGLSKELGLLDKKCHLREKSLLVRFMVTGNARMSGGINEWEVYVPFDTSAARDNRTVHCRESTYIFSPSTGFIHKQVINSIHPTPHQAVYDSLSKFLNLG